MINMVLYTHYHLLIFFSFNLLPFFNVFTYATSDNPSLTYESLYNDGVNFYLDNNWNQCVQHFEFALEDYHWWRENIISCRRKCHNESEASDHIFPKSFNYDRFFETTVINTLCLVRCKKDVFGERADKITPVDIEEAFEIRKPYDYLQLCYFKLNQFEDAANAAVTVLFVQPDHEVMQNNLQYYMEIGKLTIDNVLNLELEEFAKEYIKGDAAYSDEDYEEAIKFMKNSLQLFYEEFENCRLLCENPFNQGWYPDFISSIANHYTFTLRCKQKCNEKLARFSDADLLTFIASYFNYLQYSYSKVGHLIKACEAVESYLLLFPEDDIQLRNKQYFWTLEGVQEKYFTPREDIVVFKQRIESEEKLLKYIETKFEFLEKGSDIKPSLTLTEKDVSFKNVSQISLHKMKSRAVKYLQLISNGKIKIIAKDKELKGSNRVLVDGLLTNIECQILGRLAQLASAEGDGYRHGMNPHTSSEAFKGLTLSKIALMAHAGLIEPSVLEMVIEKTEDVLGFVEQHFKLKKSLHFSFTHLVCRSPKTEKFKNRSISDLSHAVHVDNCILQTNGDCLKIPPAYTFRDYSAILYLSDEVKGGEFIFTKDVSGVTYQSIVKPKCGRVVGFSAGEENPHGVRPVVMGNRCALAMWFTFDQKHQEYERTLAKKLLKNLKNNILMNEEQA